MLINRNPNAYFHKLMSNHLHFSLKFFSICCYFLCLVLRKNRGQEFQRNQENLTELLLKPKRNISNSIKMFALKVMCTKNGSTAATHSIILVLRNQKKPTISRVCFYARPFFNEIYFKIRKQI